MRYFMTTAEAHPSIVGVASDFDWTPTLHYYGTCRVDADLSDAEAAVFDLTPCDPDHIAMEREDAALYRAETRAGA